MILLAIIGGTLFFVGQLCLFFKAKPQVSQVETRWLAWCQQDQNSRRSREELLRQLDFWLLNEKFRLRLKRLSAVAPLFGVFLTALGFILLTDGQVGDSVLNFTPLYSGVFAGVILAILNQIFMALLEEECTTRRSESESYFSNTTDAVNTALDNFAAVIDGISTSAQATIDRAIASSAKDLKHTARAVKTAGTTIDEMAERYSEQSARIESATTSLCDSLGSVSTNLSQKSEELVTAISDIGSKLVDVQDVFVKGSSGIESAAECYGETAKKFDPMLENFRTHMESLQAATTDFQESSKTALENARELGATLKPAFDETATNISTAAKKCEQSTEQLSQAGEHLKDAAAGFETESANMNQSTSSLTAQFPEMDERLKSLTGAIERQEQALTTTPQEIARILEAMDRRLADLVTDRSNALAGTLQTGIDPTISLVGQQLQDTAAKSESSTSALIAASENLRAQFDVAKSNSDSLLDASRALTENVGTTNNKLAEQLTGLTDRLADLTISIDEQKEAFASTPFDLSDAAQQMTEASGEMAGVLAEVKSVLARSGKRKRKNPDPQDADEHVLSDKDALRVDTGEDTRRWVPRILKKTLNVVPWPGKRKDKSV